MSIATCPGYRCHQRRPRPRRRRRPRPTADGRGSGNRPASPGHATGPCLASRPASRRRRRRRRSLITLIGYQRRAVPVPLYGPVWRPDKIQQKILGKSGDRVTAPQYRRALELSGWIGITRPCGRQCNGATNSSASVFSAALREADIPALRQDCPQIVPIHTMPHRSETSSQI